MTDPSQRLQLKKLWSDTTGDTDDWSPGLLYCGSYDDDLKAFPVKSVNNMHLLWIPRECKFGLRFMNHVLYCIWHASRSPSLPHYVRLLVRIGKYTDQLRSLFFDEVLEYWYPAGTNLPAPGKPTPQSEPLHSSCLTYFLAMMYHRHTPTPDIEDRWESADTPDPLKYDWKEWTRRKAANQILFGTFPNEETEVYAQQREEALKAGILHAPSVEIDHDSWTRYASALYAEYIVWKRDLIDAENQPSLETHQEDSPAQQSALKTIDSKVTETLVSLDTLPDEASGESQTKLDSYALQLNRTHLLFIPPFDLVLESNSISGTVVQVCVRGGLGNGDINDIFAAEQASVTNTIETLLVGHVNGLHELPKCVIIKEVLPGYKLIGERKLWKYGREKKFCLGDTVLRPAEDKWIFHFEKAK